MRAIILATGVLAATLTAWAQQDAPAYHPMISINQGGGENGDNGVLHYGMTFSEGLGTYGNQSGQDVNTRTTLNWRTDYSMQAQGSQFGFAYTGGYLTSNVTGQQESLFHNFSVSESRRLSPKLQMTAKDTFSYTPDAISAGGTIAGIGGFGGGFGVGGFNPGTFAQGLDLAYGTTRLSNTVAGELAWQVNGRTSVTSSVSEGVLHFPDYREYNSRQFVVNDGVDYRLDARTSVDLQYAHSLFTYDMLVPRFSADMTSAGVQRQVTKTFSVQAFAGPQWLHYTGQINQRNLSAGAAVQWHRDRQSAAVRYVHGIVAASLGTYGATQDQFLGNYTRQLTRNLNLGFTGGRVQNSGITQSNSNIGSYTAGANLSHQVSHMVSWHVSYNYIQQTGATSGISRATFTGGAHNVDIGISLTPRGIRLQR
jgi:hypothetical protein